MTQKIPSKKDISIWKRDARAYAKANGISHSEALNLFAQNKGFQSWKHLTNSRKRGLNSSPDLFEEMLETTGLTKQAFKSIQSGELIVRDSFIALETYDVKRAKHTIITELKSIIRNSKKHALIEVRCNIPQTLYETWGDDQNKFFNSLVDKFARLTSFNVIVCPDNQTGIPLDTLLLGKKAMDFVEVETKGEK